MAMRPKTIFRVGVTPDFETEATGVISPALVQMFGKTEDIEYETMPETGGIGIAEVLDRYDAVITFSYAFPAESFRGLKRLTLLALWASARIESMWMLARKQA
jgi:hypothetical protein